MRRRCFALALAGAVTGLAGPAQAQHPIRLTAGATVAGLHVRSDQGSRVDSLSGTVLALDGSARRGPLLLEVRYGEGHLTASDSTVQARDLVEGSLLFGVRLGRYVTVLGGPRARAYADPAGTRRWVFWEARIRGAAPLIASRLDAYAEFGGTVLGSTSLSTSFGSERSGEVGARYRLFGARLALQVAYRIERDAGSLPTRSDTVERILIGVRAGR